MPKPSLDGRIYGVSVVSQDQTGAQKPAGDIQGIPKEPQYLNVTPALFHLHFSGWV